MILPDRRSGLLLVISSPSAPVRPRWHGDGWEFELHFSVSYTTRQPRKTRCRARDYHCREPRTLRQMVEGHEFANGRWCHGNQYEPAWRPVNSSLADGMDCLFDIDYQGGRQIPSSVARGKRALLHLAPRRWGSWNVVCDNVRRQQRRHRAPASHRPTRSSPTTVNTTTCPSTTTSIRLMPSARHLRGSQLRRVRQRCPGTGPAARGGHAHLLPEALMEIIDVICQAAQKSAPPPTSGSSAAAMSSPSNGMRGQMRRSGEPYLVHPLVVAKIIAELNLDVASICAVCCTIAWRTLAPPPRISAVLFDAEIQRLVEGVTKLGQIPWNTREERQAENFRKMLLAMARDIRVILVKLADRVDNMRTLQYVSRDKQERIARETREIYAPIANRFGYPVDEGGAGRPRLPVPRTRRLPGSFGQDGGHPGQPRCLYRRGLPGAACACWPLLRFPLR